MFKKFFMLFFIFSLSLIVCSISPAATTQISAKNSHTVSNSKPASDKTAIIAKAAKLQIPFVENKGQVKDKSVKFYANTFAGNVYVTEKGEIVYGLVKAESRRQKADVAAEPRSAFSNSENKNPPVFPFVKGGVINSYPTLEKGGKGGFDFQPETRNPKSETNPEQQATKFTILKESLVGAKDLKIVGENKAVTKVNYFVGDKKNWKNNISSYDEVSIGEVYNGVELKLKAYGKNVEKLFTVNPKGKVEDIKVNIQGAKNLSINKSGELEVGTELGNVKFTKPVAYQKIDGKKIEVECQFQVSSLTSKVQNTKYETRNSNHTTSHEPRAMEYGFKVAFYNTSYPLVIDPLLASTFIGGSSYEYGFSLAIDSSDNIFVAGYSVSYDYPTTAGVYNTSFNGGEDVIISKMDNSLSTLLASTIIGGDNNEYANSIFIDSSGNIYVTGATWSSNYPTTPGAYDTSFNGSIDVFVSKLNNSLTNLLASTFIGGSEADRGSSIALDSGDNIFVTGQTSSSNYPATTGAYDILYNGGYQDVFVSKLNSSLSTLLASTFIGGNNDDAASSMAIDSSGNIFVTGGTGSSNYPITPGAYDTPDNATFQVFVSKLNNSLSTLLASTFIGSGTSFAIALDSVGNIYLAGDVFGTGYYSSDFPTTPGAYDTSYNDSGFFDVFVSKLNNSLSTLLASTFIGGSIWEEAHSVVVDSSGNVLVTGSTASPNYPTAGIPAPYDGVFNGNVDVFVSKFNSSLTTLLASTFIGGSSDEQGYGIALDSSGNVFLTGNASSGFPTTAGAYDTSLNGNSDIFVSKLDNSLSADPTTTTITTTTTTTTTTITTMTTTTTTTTSTTTCTYYISPQSQNYPSSGGSGIINIFSTSGICWSTVTSNCDWVVINSWNSTLVNYSVAANLGIDQRTCTISIGYHSFTVTQDGIIPTLITLSFFTAETKGKKVVLKWQVETEIDNLGFNILRSETENGEYTKINKKLIPAKGSATKGASYKLSDKNVKPGRTYFYKLEDIDRNGTKTSHGPKSAKVSFKKK